MARPKKGTKGSIEATNRWRKTMEEKYGGKDGVHQMMQRIGSRGGQHSKRGGFASDVVGKDGLTGRQRARIAGAKGGSVSRRGSAKKKQTLAEMLEEERGRNQGIA